MQQYRAAVPTPGRRRRHHAAGPPHDPPSPAVRRYHPQPDHHHTMMSTACKNDDDVVNSSSSSSSSSREKRRRRVDVVDVNSSSSSSSSSCCRLLLLPLDVIRSILAKLPARSILRFRSVCKSWNQLISEPAFVELQLAEANRKPPSSRILVLTNHNFPSDPTNKIALHALASDADEGGGGGGGEPHRPRRSLLFERELASNESSTMMLPYDCDGLVLLYSKTDIWVCNPSTRETLHLPGFSPSRPLYRDPAQCLGFGLDPLTNLYKVVRFYFHSFEYGNDNDYGGGGESSVTWEVGCEVFTLDRNRRRRGGSSSSSSSGEEFQSWRQIDNPTDHWVCPTKHAVSVNGSLYWTTNCSSLISFDLRHREGEELFVEHRPPSAAHNSTPQRRWDTFWDTFIIKGKGGGGDERLWYVKVNRDDITFDIWEMNHTESWTKSWTSIHRISFQTLATEPILSIPMLVIRDDGRCILLSNQEKLQRYDVVSKEYKTMLTIEEDGATLLCPSVFRETLVSFKAAAAAAATNY